MVERKLEMESRPISALGPAPQQLKERNFTRKKLGGEIPSILPSNTFKGLGRTELETLGWGSQASALLTLA